MTEGQKPQGGFHTPLSYPRGLASSSLPHHYLQKGAGFHLDFFCVAMLLLPTSVLGLPWYVSTTVISLAHVDSLRRESRACAPGEPPSFLGIR